MAQTLSERRRELASTHKGVNSRRELEQTGHWEISLMKRQERTFTNQRQYILSRRALHKLSRVKFRCQQHCTNSHYAAF